MPLTTTMKLISTTALVGIASSSPVVPQSWSSANATYSNFGTLPDCAGGESLSLSYDFAHKRKKQVWKTGTHAGFTDVFRYDKNVPGEPWTRGYHWKPGHEAVCCYFNLCRGGQPCSAMTAERMEKLEVASGATDEGPAANGQGEKWHKDMSIKVLDIGNVNDWVVDTKIGAIANWTSNASLPKGTGWCHSTRLYREMTLGNYSDADFAYPKFCDQEECNANVISQIRQVW